MTKLSYPPFIILALVLQTAIAGAQAKPATNADRVLVVKNEKSVISIDVADDYCAKRHVKSVVSIYCADSATNAANETTTWATYQSAIEKPIATFLEKHPQIDFIVLTKGVPIRIQDAPGRGIGNNRPSVDSTLASIGYDTDPKAIKIAIDDSGFKGTAFANRYWQTLERFSHAKFGGYLVTRLDGYTEEDAKALVTRSLESEKQRPAGSILLDSCADFGYADKSKQPIAIFDPPKPGKVVPPLADVNFNHYNADMQLAADLLKARDIVYELDENGTFVGNREGLAGYCSWGSNDKHYDEKAYHSLKFAPGALVETAVSTSGRTFLSATGGQSLIADLIQQGATGAKGYCDEPFLTAIASPSILFDRYTRGWTLAESFYAASRFVGWEDIVLGDPLCCPYAERTIAKPSAKPTKPGSVRGRKRHIAH